MLWSRPFSGLECPFPYTLGTSTLAGLLDCGNALGARGDLIEIRHLLVYESWCQFHGRHESIHTHCGVYGTYCSYTRIRLSSCRELSATFIFGTRCVSASILVILLAP